MEFDYLKEQYTPMIHAIYQSIHIYKNQEEFYQIGLIALWEASRLYDARKGKFSTYAYKWIHGKMLTFLSENNKEEPPSFRNISTEEWIEDFEVYEDHYFEKENLLSHFQYLTDREKNWVILYFHEGLSNREIARKEKLKMEGIRSIQKRAMKKCLLQYRG